ncbi:hypothetical protein PPTG_19386 [Phytophthora nicotianae INRA-310]|uniref:Uncharacterized protein n=1 Tax=Phytophthora nicotianae (strain INRA-310) TaxID=761204 RepID=W2PF61_PHYN3|nr:hypothetical protein PPTG_19386 [Phytophthora nicotianae INRA-310]ETM98833.1 hypothetical protein PPTG_19386 [Phytophthora nicotianae INRA-310]
MREVEFAIKTGFISAERLPACQKLCLHHGDGISLVAGDKTRELQEYVRARGTLVASLAENPPPEDIKTTVFMKEYGHGQFGKRNPPRLDRRSLGEEGSTDAPAVAQPLDTGANSKPEPMDLSSVESFVRWYGSYALRHYHRVCPSRDLEK